MIACTHLADSLNQLAHGAAIGAAAMCIDPGQTQIAAPQPPIQTAAASPNVQRRWNIERQALAPGNASRWHGLIAHRADIDTDLSPGIALGLEQHFAAEGSGSVAASGQPASPSGQHSAKSRQLNDGYVFFNEKGELAQAPDCPAAAACADGGSTISGESAADVSGDDIDYTLKNYDLTPDLLMTRGGLTFSGGYSSVEGAGVGAKLTRKNIGGLDREVAASVRVSQLRQAVEIGYGDGHFLGSSLAMAPTLFATRISAKGFGSGFRTTPFAQGSYGVTIQLSRKFENQLTLNAGYRLSADSLHMRGKNRTCDVALFGSPLCNSLGNITNSQLSVSLVFDRRIRARYATRGFRLRLAQETGVGGSAPFSRTRIGGEAHLGLGERLTLLMDIEGGYLSPLGKRDVPLFDRFYAGDTSLRGFDLRGVGPKVRPTGATAAQNVALGGRAYYAARIELSASAGGFFEKLGLQPGIFVDAGSVFGARRTQIQPGEELIGNAARPRVSIGVGLAWKSPAGTLRFDLAKPVSRQRGDRTQLFGISFGAAL